MSIDEEQLESEEGYKTSYEQELKIVGKNALPLIITLLLQYSMTTVTMLSVGHLGELELAGVSIANVTFGLCNAIFAGMATCLDTLCPQAYGAKKYHLVGLYWQRCMALCLFLLVPVAIFFVFSASFLKFIVPHEDVIELAQEYLRILTIGLPGLIVFETGKRFLQAQGDFKCAQYILFICAPLNVLLNYLFVFKFGLGYRGAPLSIVFNYYLMSGLLACYIVLIDGMKCWSGFDATILLHNWEIMVGLAVPGIIMILTEFLAFEIITLACSYLSVEELASQSIASNLASLSFQIPFGLSIAASTRISYLIGTKSIISINKSVKVTIFYSFFIGIFSCCVLFFGRFKIPLFFTNEKLVIKTVSAILPIIAINQLYDSVNVIGAGCLRAQGRQKIGGYLNLIAYYVLGVPIGLILCFKYDLRIKGLWIGIGVGVLILGLLELTFIYFSNWNSIIKESIKRHEASDSSKVVIDEESPLI